MKAVFTGYFRRQFRFTIITMREDIVLEVNGKRVKLKDFPMRALKGTILGFVKSLNLEEEPKEIRIKIKVDEEDKGSS